MLILEQRDVFKIVKAKIPLKKGDDVLNIVFALFETSDRGVDIQFFHEQLIRAITTENYDLMLAPEYSYLQNVAACPDGCGKALNADERDRNLEELLKATKGRSGLVIPGTFVWFDQGKNMFNTAYGIERNEITFMYNKRNDGGESFIASANKLSPAYGGYSSVFRWNRNKVSIDICADHNLYNDEKEKVDLGLLIASGIGYIDNINRLKNGGYFLRIDGDEPTVEIIQRKRGIFYGYESVFYYRL